jgi:hypothetical protein
MPMKAEYDAGALAAMRVIQQELNSDEQSAIDGNATLDVMRRFAQVIAHHIIDAAADARAKIQQRDY